MSLPKPYYEDEARGIVIYNADARELLPYLPKVDLLLTDPPYGIGVTKMTLGNRKSALFRGNEDWDSVAPNLLDYLPCAEDHVVWGGNFFELPVSAKWLVWDKCTGANDFADCELAWTSQKGAVRKFSYQWIGSNAKDPGTSDRSHPTQKPLALMLWCLGFFPKAETVLDPFMGSGTTLVACKQLGRKCIGIELEEKYCEIAVRRLSQDLLFDSEELAQL